MYVAQDSFRLLNFTSKQDVSRNILNILESSIFALVIPVHHVCDEKFSN